MALNEMPVTGLTVTLARRLHLIRVRINDASVAQTLKVNEGENESWVDSSLLIILPNFF